MKSFTITPENAGEYAQKIGEFIKQKLASAGVTTVVLGLSGGIDSAVVAYLCKRGGIPLSLLMLPDGENEMADARLLLDDLGLTAQTINLAPLAGLVEREFEGLDGMGRLNIRPRLRMIMLYAEAARCGGLVAGTGNASEILTGYFTKWGDGANDFLPLANLTKREVRVLARELGVPARIIEKPPSADLFEGQTDEGELGFSYDEIDDFILGGTSGNATTDERLRARGAQNEHKNRPASAFEG